MLQALAGLLHHVLILFFAQNQTCNKIHVFLNFIAAFILFYFIAHETRA